MSRLTTGAQRSSFRPWGTQPACPSDGAPKRTERIRRLAPSKEYSELKVAEKLFKKPKKRDLKRFNLAKRKKETAGVRTRLLEVWNYGNRGFVKQKLDFKQIFERNLETSVTPFNLQKWRFFGTAIVLAALIGVFVAMIVFMEICWCLNDNDKAPNQVDCKDNDLHSLETNWIGESHAEKGGSSLLIL
ncbi:hypothetical protein CRE_15707 [Caenorhabditis remanei]|uniref:Uncharacterized protein n=1 Tax=Caenorhabditis remanei TaxID=31234 RepID=E3NCB6_CAERE|nr:hypothetical protein CRE_15707 [Caenorhabditis remanei]